MTLNEVDSKYFFKNTINCIFQDDKEICMKKYLKALAEGHNVELQRIRQKFETENERIEEIYVKEWLEALLPYFKRPQHAELVHDMTLTTQNELYLEQKCNVNETFFVDDFDSWAEEPRVLSAFLIALMRIRDFKWIAGHLHLIFPMICQVQDDYRAEFKVTGVQICKEFIRLVPREIIQKYNMHVVLFESFGINFTFESEALLKGTLSLWIEVIEKMETFGSKGFLSRCDQLLLLLNREVGLARSEGRKVIILYALDRLVNFMQFTVIRFTRKLVINLCEVMKDEEITKSDQNAVNDLKYNCEVFEAGTSLMCSIIKNCWIRFDEQLKDHVRDHFLFGFEKCNASVRALLDEIK